MPRNDQQWDEGRKAAAEVYDHSRAKLVGRKTKIRQSRQQAFLSVLQDKKPSPGPQPASDTPSQVSSQETRCNAEEKSPSDTKKNVQIFIRGPLLTKPLSMQLDPETSISSLKELIQNKSGIDPKVQHLFIRKLELCDLLSLQDHGIVKDDNIELRVPVGLLGGAPKKPTKNGNDDDDATKRQSAPPTSHAEVQQEAQASQLSTESGCSDWREDSTKPRPDKRRAAEADSAEVQQEAEASHASAATGQEAGATHQSASKQTSSVSVKRSFRKARKKVTQVFKRHSKTTESSKDWGDGNDSTKQQTASSIPHPDSAEIQHEAQACHTSNTADWTEDKGDEEKLQTYEIPTPHVDPTEEQQKAEAFSTSAATTGLQLDDKLFQDISQRFGETLKDVAIKRKVGQAELQRFVSEKLEGLVEHCCDMLVAWSAKPDNRKEAIGEVKEAFDEKAQGDSADNVPTKQGAKDEANDSLPESMSAKDVRNSICEVYTSTVHSSQIKRAALGRRARIGTLYDIITDSFLDDSVLGVKDEDDNYVVADRTSTELVTTDNLFEKLKKIGVEGDIQLSLLSGMVEWSGYGAYLGEERKSAQAKRMSLLYSLKTLSENVQIPEDMDKIASRISENVNENATHVVIGIDWGAVCSITCETENGTDDVSEVEGALYAELERLKELIEVEECESAAYVDQDRKKHNIFTFKCETNVVADDKDPQVTFTGAVELARKLPELIKDSYNGKGVPLTYVLLPLDAIVKMCNLHMEVEIQYREINEETVKNCAQVFEEICKRRQLLYDIKNDLHASKDYVAEEAVNTINSIIHEFTEAESGYKLRLQELVKKKRSGCKDVSDLETFLRRDLNGVFPASHYTGKMAAFQTDIEKAKYIKSWRNKGIIYIGGNENLTVDNNKTVYVFYKSSDGNNKSALERNQDFFLRLQTTYADDKQNYDFVVVDKEIDEDLLAVNENKAAIYKFVKGSLKSKDVYLSEGQDCDRCVIKMGVPLSQEKAHGQTSKRAIVKLTCPGSFENGQCGGTPFTWECLKCKDVVEYDMNTKHFVCKCGQFNPRGSLFRCSQSEHGINYFKYPDHVLSQKLASLQALKEKTILILGETGVGKSTWINGFVNYLYYANLEEAINAQEFHVLIPSRFTFTQGKQTKNIFIGNKDENEIAEVGKSATQEPRCYVFRLGELKVRLIDTPGVGDIRGMQEDKKNFDNILSYLTHFDEIHAVCILLKPNNARLTITFRFCIQELLIHLHSSAKQNIVFCFTNARATFYQPGDTLPVLNEELRLRKVEIEATPENYFCFDNEPFRFLACLKKGVTFQERDINIYAESWNKSVEETQRLFRYINTLKPHKVRNTLSMNEARRIILVMSKPLAVVAKTIEQNVHQGNEAKHLIDLCNDDVASLNKHLKTTGLGLKCIPLGYPRTVCAHTDCIKHVQIGKELLQNTTYPQICHHHCSLKGIPTETTNDPRLQGCWCIKGTDCHQCGHPYNTHMHITYKTEEYPVEFLSDKVQAQIKKKKDLKEAKQALKNEIDMKKKELQEEEDFIIKTGAKYGSFLKATAMILYNDAVGDYLDMSIEQEQQKPMQLRKKDLLDAMVRMKAEYEQNRKILDEAMDGTSGENITTPEEVFELQEKLFSLKHMGQTLREIFGQISILHSSNNINFRETTAPVRRHYKKNKGNWMARIKNVLGY